MYGEDYIKEKKYTIVRHLDKTELQSCCLLRAAGKLEKAPALPFLEMTKMLNQRFAVSI
jgi:hypothetical protein